MSHELPKKLKIMRDTAASCGRMRLRLCEALEIIEDARREDGAAMAGGKPGSWRHLSAALCKLRELMRPEPGTLAWHTEIDYYLDREPRLRWVSEEVVEPAAGTGAFFTPPEAIDAITQNPPLDIPPAAEPIQPGTPKMVPGEKPHMRRDVAAGLLMGLMRKRTMSEDHVVALNMGAHWLMKKHFEKQRYWARRRALRSACGPHPAPLTPEEELADTIARQKELDV